MGAFKNTYPEINDTGESLGREDFLLLDAMSIIIELANELEMEIKLKYEALWDIPKYKREYEIAMLTVVKAREFVSQLDSEMS